MLRNQKTTHHVAITVDYVLRVADAGDIFIHAGSGEPMSSAEAKAHATICKARGYEVVPPCGNHDARGHCKGHPVTD